MQSVYGCFSSSCDTGRMKQVAMKTAAKIVFQPWFRFRRGLTLGVRGLVRNKDGHILLVRHTYAPGWMFPGGGVELAETAPQALIRELKEEAGITAATPPRLLGLYANRDHFPGDHIALYLVENWEQGPSSAFLEIAEYGFFPEDELPSGTPHSVQARLKDVNAGVQSGDIW